MVPVSHISLPHFAAVYTHTVLTDGVHSAPPLVDGAGDAADEQAAEVPAFPSPVKKAKSTPRIGCGLRAIRTDTDNDSDTASAVLISSDSSQPTTKTILTDLPRLRPRRSTVTFKTAESSSESDAPGTDSVSFAVYTLPHIVTMQCKEELQECSAVRMRQQSAKEIVLPQVHIQTLPAYLCSVCMQCIHYTHSYEHSWAKKGHNAAA